jgi:hypothetical protein
LARVEGVKILNKANILKSFCDKATACDKAAAAQSSIVEAYLQDLSMEEIMARAAADPAAMDPAILSVSTLTKNIADSE